MTGRQFGGLLAMLLVATVATYGAAPGLAVVVLVAGAFGLAVADYRVAERGHVERERRRRMVEAAHRNEFGGESWRNS